MMAAAFDVAGRLSEGDRALTVLDEYVAACQVLGVASPGPLAELYRAESGLDLDALAADARSLDAAVVAAQDALRLQGNGYREPTAQWSGMGGDAAGGFLRSLTVTAEDVVTHLQRSAQALTTLRDELWRAVDAKVDAVLRTEARAAGHRDQWSAASRAVLAGAGDMSAASEIVDQQVKPFVLGAVSGDLMPALQDAADTVAAAYDSAVAAVTPAGLSFPVPVVLSPEWAPQAPSSPPLKAYQAAPAAQADQVAPAAPFGALGAAAGWTPSASPAPAEPFTTPSASTSGAPEPALGTAAATPAAAGLPGDPGSGSGISGLGQQLTDAIGGALGSMAGLAPGASGLGGLDNIRDGLGDDLGIGADADDELDDEPAGGVDDDPDGELDDGEEDADEEDADEENTDESGTAEGDATESDAAEGHASDSADADSGPVDGPGPTSQQPVSAPPVTDPAPTTPPVEPVAEQPDPATKTPCEIAADELPNVGE